MATLAKVTSETRIILKFLAASLIFITILFVFYKGGEFVKNTFFPTPLPPPEEGLGKLPIIDFPAQNPINFEYRVNTISGRLPVFGDRMTVYKTKTSEPSLVALERARNNLSNVGFVLNETKINDTVYQWDNRQGERIQINILTNNFKISSNFINSALPERISRSMTNKEEVISFVKSFLQDMRINSSNISNEKSILSYLKVVNNNLVDIESESDAQFVRVDLFQGPIEQDYEIYYPKLQESIMYFIIRSDGAPRIVEAEFTHVIPDENNSSTYPIKSAEVALGDLNNGNALIFYQGTGQNTIDITDVKLGYYIENEEQQYFLPIVVFVGKDFTAYVQAIPESSIQ